MNIIFRRFSHRVTSLHSSGFCFRPHHLSRISPHLERYTSSITMTKPKILLLGDILQYVYDTKRISHSQNVCLSILHLLTGIHFSDSAHKSWGSLADIGELVKCTATDRADFLRDCHEGKLDGVVAAYRTFASGKITGRIDGEIVSALPKSLKFLAHCGAGYDQIDVHACSARDPPVRVSNVPTAVDDATADVNMFLIIGALRNFNAGMVTLRQGKWLGNPPPALGHDPEGKVCAH